MNRQRNPYPTTDLIIEYQRPGEERIVLIKRNNPPYGIALPGGFAEWGLSLEENACKEAREETGLHIKITSPEQPFCVHSSPSRDPRGHMISITYIAKGYGTICAGDDAKEARPYTLREVRQLIRENALAFDHGRILEKYLRHREELCLA
ncbi:MAG TPA: NUDIX hydrolase [Candidatus Nanoarchaeia archaeon]|nr:NUDIX hydrolase [Candidatus Nanoarchaeia archaeon]